MNLPSGTQSTRKTTPKKAEVMLAVRKATLELPLMKKASPGAAHVANKAARTTFVYGKRPVFNLTMELSEVAVSAAPTARKPRKGQAHETACARHFRSSDLVGRSAHRLCSSWSRSDIKFVWLSSVLT
jgi:hypothetical protein